MLHRQLLQLLEPHQRRLRQQAKQHLLRHHLLERDQPLRRQQVPVDNVQQQLQLLLPAIQRLPQRQPRQMAMLLLLQQQVRRQPQQQQVRRQPQPQPLVQPQPQPQLLAMSQLQRPQLLLQPRMEDQQLRRQQPRQEPLQV